MLKNVKIKFKKVFKMTNLGIISNILGIKIQREGETGKIRLSQQKYVNELYEKLICETRRPCSRQLHRM